MKTPANPTVLLATPGLTPSQRKRSFGDVVYVPRSRQAGEALPAQTSVWKQPDYTPPPEPHVRPGANDHMRYRSKGYLT